MSLTWPLLPVTWGTYGMESLSALYPGPARHSAISAVWKYSSLSSLSNDSGSLGRWREMKTKTPIHLFQQNPTYLQQRLCMIWW